MVTSVLTFHVPSPKSLRLSDGERSAVWDDIGGSWVGIGSGCEAMRMCKEAGREIEWPMGWDMGQGTIPFRVWRCIEVFPVCGCIGSTAKWLAWIFVEKGGVLRVGGNVMVDMLVEIALLHGFSISVVPLSGDSSAWDGVR
nr:hypothetical protein L203_01883 [Cryptococcus depauperatus CBS 7841]